MTGRPDHKRIGQLDGVRAVAILAVFVHHALHVKLLWAGVDLFFILSGFLITGILLGGKEQSLGGYFQHFYGRRARRILPAYAVMLILTTFVCGFAWARHWYLYLFLMNSLVAFQVLHPAPVEVLWSLAVEEQFYMAWPFAIYFLSEATIAWVAGGLMVAAPLLRWFCTPLFAAHWAIYALTPFRMDLLAAGALIAVLWRRDRSKIERYGVYGPIVSGLAVGALAVASRRHGFSTYANTREANVWIYELSLIACAGIVLWALGGRHVGLLSWGPVRYLGRISYTVYLIHTLVLMMVGDHVHGRMQTFAIAAALSVGYAALSWRFFEQPILMWKPGSRVRREAEQDELANTRPQAVGSGSMRRPLPIR